MEVQSKGRQSGAKGGVEGLTGSEWEGILRRGVELAQGPTTDQFLQVVDLYPEQKMHQASAALCLPDA